MSSWHHNRGYIPINGHLIIGIVVMTLLMLSLSPTPVCSQTAPTRDTLITDLDFNNSSYGVMFDIESRRAATLDFLYANLGVSFFHRVRIYYKEGSHQGWESDQSAWTFMGEAVNVASNGLDTLTRIPIPLSVELDAQDTNAFYIAVVSAIPGDIGAPSHILYTEADTLGISLAEDEHLIIKTGVALGGFNSLPFQGSIVSPRSFNGAVEYTSRRLILTCPPDTVLPCTADYAPMALCGAQVISYCSDEWTLSHTDSIVQMTGIPAISKVIYRIWRVADDCGNEEQCIQKITLTDTVKPAVTVINEPVFDCSDFNVAAAFKDWFSQSVQVQECGEIVLQFDSASLIPPISGCGNFDYEFSVRDGSGNTAVVHTVVLFEDNTPPALDVPVNDMIFEQTDLFRLNFDGLDEGAISNIELGGVGIDITATSVIGPAEAWIFDTENPQLSDPDLGSPNKMYGGQGVSQNDINGWSASNNRALNEVLIVQNPFSSIPNDFFLSESIGFAFDRPVFVHAITLLDIEESQNGAHIRLFDALDSQIDSIPVYGGADNSVMDVLIATPGVARLEFYFGGDPVASGAIAELSFAVLPGLPSQLFSDACSAVTVDTNWVMEFTDSCNCKLIQSATAFDQCGNMSATLQRELDLRFDVSPPKVKYLKPLYALCDSVYPQPNPELLTIDDECTFSEVVTTTWVGDFELTSETECGEPEKFRLYKTADIHENERLVRQDMSKVTDSVALEVKLLLGGSIPFWSNNMHPTLTDLIPPEQPYLQRYGHTSDETLESINGEMIDWVLIQLYDEWNESLYASTAAILMQDGSVVSNSGSEMLMFLVPKGFYRIRVRHRNHLDIVCQDAMYLNPDSATVCDLIQDWSFEDQPPEYLKAVSSDPWEFALQPGDINADNRISYLGVDSDRNEILDAIGVQTPGNSLVGYLTEDVNFDRVVNFDGGLSDRLTILLTVGFITPANVIEGPLID